MSDLNLKPSNVVDIDTALLLKTLKHLAQGQRNDLAGLLFLLYSAVMIFLAGAAGMRYLFRKGLGTKTPNRFRTVFCGIIFMFVAYQLLPGDNSWNENYKVLFTSDNIVRIFYFLFGINFIITGIGEWKEYKSKMEAKEDISRLDFLSKFIPKDYIRLFLEPISIIIPGAILCLFKLEWGIPLIALGASVWAEIPSLMILGLFIPNEYLRKADSQPTTTEDTFHPVQ